MTSEVLIVGGGPTGMTLALQLHRYGVPFRIIEKRRKEPSPSKALSINTASLHILHDLGLGDALVALGHKTRVVNLIYGGRRLLRARFDRLHSRYPFFLMLPQPQTEQLMEEQLERFHHRVERDCEFMDLRQEPRGVRVRIRNGAQLEERSYAYVAGCDGALSAVREAIGFDFRGYDYHMHFLLTDVRIRWPGAHEEGHYFVRDDGFLILLPLKSGYHRIVIKASGSCAPGYKPTLDEIRAYIARYDISELQVDDPIWLSSAPFYMRSAPAFRRDRVFIAGDAAHLFSPIGGFGMNTGIGDAFNLGWKLGYALNGAGGESLLQSYSDERHGNTRKLLVKTDRSTSLIARLDRHAPEDEQRFMPLMRNRNFMRMFPWDASGLTLAYGLADAPPLPHRALECGRQLPYMDDTGAACDSLGLIGNGAHRLLLVPPSDVRGAKRAAEFADEVRQASGGRVKPLLLVEQANSALPASFCLQDAEQRLRRAYRLAEGEFALVRPDFYIACTGHLGSADALREHLQALYGFGAATAGACLAS